MITKYLNSNYDGNYHHQLLAQERPETLEITHPFDKKR